MPGIIHLNILSSRYPGLICQTTDKFYGYGFDWCKTGHDCDGVLTTDRGICRNSTSWIQRPCPDGYLRGVCKETPGRCCFEDSICDGLISTDDSGSCGFLDFRQEDYMSVNDIKFSNVSVMKFVSIPMQTMIGLKHQATSKKIPLNLEIILNVLTSSQGFTQYLFVMAIHIARMAVMKISVWNVHGIMK